LQNKFFYYITFNDSFSGIFSSQVIDVLKLYESMGVDFRLISFISIRNYFFNRSKIKAKYPKSYVFPSFPKIKFWRFNRFWLSFFYFENSVVICRGIFASNLLISCKKSQNCKIIYDGRGAIYAESNEYKVFKGTGVESQIYDLEKSAVLKSDFKISVSSELVRYWYNKFEYVGNNHLVIPCSFNYSNSKIDIKRESMGFSDSDIVIVFSGSNSLWHSFDLMIKNIGILLKYNSKIKCLILSKDPYLFDTLKSTFKDRIIVKWVESDSVISLLKLCDYGYVFRENTITNNVASPVKIAEYLAAGLRIIISNNIIDYSRLINDNNLGFVIDEYFDDLQLEPVSLNEKNRISNFALNNLSKESEKIKDLYYSLV
jgi:hypothetical protein